MAHFVLYFLIESAEFFKNEICYVNFIGESNSKIKIRGNRAHKGDITQNTIFLPLFPSFYSLLTYNDFILCTLVLKTEIILSACANQ